jgi:hypothetical protein
VPRGAVLARFRAADLAKRCMGASTKAPMGRDRAMGEEAASSKILAMARSSSSDTFSSFPCALRCGSSARCVQGQQVRAVSHRPFQTVA